MVEGASFKGAHQIVFQAESENHGNQGYRFLRKVLKVRKAYNKFPIKYIIYQQILYFCGFSKNNLYIYTRIYQIY